LESLGLAENTLVIYTSDHGNHFKTRNPEYKRSAHEASIRIPLVMCGPGFRGGKTFGGLVSLLDLPPTLLAAAGAVQPGGMPGRALQDSIAEVPFDRLRGADSILIQTSENTLGRAIRTRRWKYSVCNPLDDGWRNASSPWYVEGFLYDLENDPHEQENLIRDGCFAGIRIEMRQQLLARLAEIGETAEIQPAVSPLKFWALKTLGALKNTLWLYWKVATQFWS
jgi:arylsulfatase A-like enzyme